MSNLIQAGYSRSDGDQSSTHIKRRRSPNYTDQETRTLFSLVIAHFEIIENKKADAETCRMKDLAWSNITENYNKCLGTTKRTVDMLRQKYDSIKKLAKKKRVKNQEEEGKEAPNFIEMEDYEKELLQLLENQGVNTNQSLDITVLHESEDDSESKIETSNIKTEQNSSIHGSEEIPDEQFIITDDDVFWELPSDTANRPRLHLIKKQLEQLEKQEKRQIAEHRHRMQTDRIKRRLLINQEKRARLLHEKEMELLDLEIETQKKLLQC